ncbi:MAG: GFA family protein [Actinomycetota bacterium]|nr:GFA family protein [Actinomycetota bacterium]
MPREGFRLLTGEDLILRYRPAEGMVKAFCRECGSSLFGGTWPDGPEVSVRLGSRDEDPGIRPQYHTYVGSKAPWDEICDDGLPRYPGPPPSSR